MLIALAFRKQAYRERSLRVGVARRRHRLLTLPVMVAIVLSLVYRQVVNGILWILRTGASWRDMPERYRKWQNIATRFYRWQKAGIWKQILAHLQAAADEQGKLDWEVHYVDGTVIRAHQHAAGGKKGGRRQLNVSGFVILHPLPYLPYSVFSFDSFIQNTRKVTEEG